MEFWSLLAKMFKKSSAYIFWIPSYFTKARCPAPPPPPNPPPWSPSCPHHTYSNSDAQARARIRFRIDSGRIWQKLQVFVWNKPNSAAKPRKCQLNSLKIETGSGPTGVDQHGSEPCSGSQCAFLHEFFSMKYEMDSHFQRVLSLMKWNRLDM